MDDDIEPAFIKHPVHQCPVANVSLYHACPATKGSHIGSLQSRIIEIIEVIHDGDVRTQRKKPVHSMRTDETCAAGDESLHYFK
jgi:hypothetical protein